MANMYAYEDINTLEDWEPEDSEIYDMEDDDWDSEDWEPEGMEDDDTERRRRRWSRYRRPTRSYSRSTRYARGAKGATVRTSRGGSARIRFQKPLATQESVNKSIKALKTHIVKVEKTVVKNTSVLDKKVNAVRSDIKKSQPNMQMMMMLPLLLQKNPEPIEFNLKKAGESVPSKYEVTDPQYKSQDNTLLLLLPMMMSGGMSSDDSMGMMMMALVLAGGIK